jgi:hypothetical protein
MKYILFLTLSLSACFYSETKKADIAITPYNDEFDL